MAGNCKLRLGGLPAAIASCESARAVRRTALRSAETSVMRGNAADNLLLLGSNVSPHEDDVLHERLAQTTQADIWEMRAVGLQCRRTSLALQAVVPLAQSVRCSCGVSSGQGARLSICLSQEKRT